MTRDLNWLSYQLCSIGIKVDTFRLLTKKSGSSKGCGFMELTSSKQHQVTLHSRSYASEAVASLASLHGTIITDSVIINTFSESTWPTVVFVVSCNS